MKPETLIKRYSTFGYEPKGLPLHLEIEEINLWLLKKHDVYVTLQFFDTTYKMDGKVYFKKGTFGTRTIWGVSDHHPQTFTTKKHFKNPTDAKFDALRDKIQAIRFQFY